MHLSISGEKETKRQRNGKGRKTQSKCVKKREKEVERERKRERSIDWEKNREKESSPFIALLCKRANDASKNILSSSKVDDEGYNISSLRNFLLHFSFRFLPHTHTHTRARRYRLPSRANLSVQSLAFATWAHDRPISLNPWVSRAAHRFRVRAFLFCVI